MKICPRCQFYNQDKNKACLRCGWILDALKDLPVATPKIRLRPFAFIPRTLRGVVRGIGKIFHSEIPEAPHRFPYVAALLSLFLGLGQVYNHQYKKAAFFFIAYIIGLVAVVSTITASYSNLIILLFIAFVLYAYNDGLATAVRINGQIWTFRYSLAAYSALFFLLGAGSLVGQFFIAPAFKIIRVSQNTLAPTFHKRDMVFVDCLSYWIVNPRVGDMAFYSPEALHIEVPGMMEGTRYSIKESRTFETIMGLPGDVVERKAGKFFRNGKPMPPWCQPVCPDNIFQDLRFEVPKDKYLAIYSHSPEQIHLGPSFGGKTPALNSPNIILVDWDKVCFVEKKQIIGRVLFIFNPPRHRRIMLPP